MRILSFLLLCALTCSTGVAGQFGNFIYSESGGKITITGLVNIGAGVTGTIPGVINGKPVTAIGDHAFNGSSVYGEVTLPNSITSIGAGSFAYSLDLLRINFGTGLTRIGDYAFAICTKLQSLAFPAGLTSLGDGSFQSCSSLKHITITAKVNHLGDSVFGGCKQLTYFTVDPLNPVFSSDGSSCLDKSQTTLVICPGGYAGTYTVPGTVTMIGSSAFAHSTGLKGVVIPKTVNRILAGAFYNCIQLESIGVDPLNTEFTSVDGVCFDKGQTTLVAYPGGKKENYFVPDTVTSIAGRAFGGAILRSVRLPERLTHIGSEAFLNCQSLINLAIPATVNQIDDSAFDASRNLLRVYFAGNPPAQVGANLSGSVTNLIIYYQDGTTGWKSTFAGLRTQVWNPIIPLPESNLGPGPGGFAFQITGATNIPVAVEVSTNLTSTAWTSLKTVTLTSGSVTISDPAWTKYRSRFYRLRFPD